jgi:hypothetical protein
VKHVKSYYNPIISAHGSAKVTLLSDSTNDRNAAMDAS